jgi:hypothetical protein
MVVLALAEQTVYTYNKFILAVAMVTLIQDINTVRKVAEYQRFSSFS